MKRQIILIFMCSLLVGCSLMCSSCNSHNDIGTDNSSDTAKIGTTGTDTDKPDVEPAKYSTELYDVDGNSIIFKKPDGYRMKLTFNKDNMVRFRFAPGKSDFLPDDTITEAISKQDSDYSYIAPEITDESDKIVISTAKLTVEVSKSDYSLIFYDSTGKILTRSTASPFKVNGEGKKFSLVPDAGGEKEHFYGLGADPGLSYTTTDHRGKTFSLWLDETNVHGITPLYYSTAGYGIYLHNSNKGTISFLDKNYSINIDGGEMDCYFFYGPSFEEILSDYTELSGYMNMPPLYSLGLSVASANEANAQTILNNIKLLYDAGIKFDTVAEVVGWQTARYPCSYLWNDRFTKDPSSFITAAHSLGVHLVFWGHPYVSPTSPIYDTIAPYSLLGSDIGARIWGDGTLAYGFGGLVPDLTIPEARDIYWNIQNEKLFSLGIDGAWIDETDSWPCDDKLTTVFPSGLTANAYHNLLGTLTANLTHERLKEQYNKRALIFCRGNYAGQQKYATVSYTDFYEFDQFLMGVIGQGFAGTYFTPEIRNANTPNDIDYQRRIQMMFFTPFPRNNEWIDGQLVTSRSKAVRDTYKKYDDIHYALIPYTYSCFWEQHNTGLGVIRPLPLAFYGDEEAYKIDNQYMYGDSFLVCPVNSRAKIATTSIYLPAGYDWYDYNSGYIFKGGQTIQYSSACDTLPLFIKCGSIIPMKHYGNNTEELADGNIDIDVYPSEKEASFELFEDDGISYDYEKGAYAVTAMSVIRADGKITFTSEKRTDGFDIADRFCTLRIHYRCEPNSVILNGTELKKADSLSSLAGNTAGWFYVGNGNDTEKIIYVRYKDDGEKKTVTVTAGNEDPQTAPKVLEEEYEAPMEGTLYECEGSNAEFHDGPGITNQAAASGHAAVFGIMKQGYLVMNGITAPEDGLYKARLKYLSGADKLICHISVNGGKDFVVYLYNTGGWGVTGYVDMVLPLKKGENSIKFYGLMEEDGVPYLDCLIVSDAKPVEGSALESIDLSKAKTTNNVKKTKCATSPSGFVYGPFAGSSDRIGFEIVKPGDNDGSSSPFMIELTYSNPDINDKELTMNVNGTDYSMILPTTYSYEQFATVSQTIYLNNGSNTVMIYPNGAQGVDLGIGGISVS